jgi:hypothetical protein
VVTVSHSFVATANAIRYCGAQPVFVDVEPDTYNIDPAGVGPRILGLERRPSWWCTRLGCPATWRGSFRRPAPVTWR